MLYESIVLFGLLWAVGLAWGVATGQRSALMHRGGLQVVSFLALAVYCVGFWSGPGQTVAMRAWHVRVVDVRGDRLPAWRAALRFLLAWAWVLPPLIIAWALRLGGPADMLLLTLWVAAWSLLSRLQADRQFLHDAWAGTRLVDTRDSPDARDT